MKIGIIAAMEPELKELTQRLENTKSQQKAGFEFYEGHLEGTDVVLLLSGIGKVNAAVGTALLIENFAPTTIINTGVAGGFNTSLNPGDVVISTEVRHHDADAQCFGYAYGQVPGMPEAYLPDEKLLHLALESAQKSTSHQVESGLIVSGDIFIHKPQDAKRILEVFPHALAGEMEAAAVAQTCHRFSIPWIMARSLSDIIGSGENALEYEQFLPMAARQSTHFVITLAQAITREFQ